MAKKGEGPGWANGPNFREKAVYIYIYGYDGMGCGGMLGKM